jgi:hypothetical protein
VKIKGKETTNFPGARNKALDKNPVHAKYEENYILPEGKKLPLDQKTLSVKLYTFELICQ